MKTRFVASIVAIVVLGSCANAGTRQSESNEADSDLVAASQTADDGTGIIAPDFKVLPDTSNVIQFLFDYPTNRLKVSSDGKPIIFTVDSLGLENPEGVRRVEKAVSYYIRFRKGERYYDYIADSEKIAEEEIAILSEESLPYREVYEFDEKGRLKKYVYCDEDFLTFDYHSDGSFTYTAEHKQTDGFYPIKIKGKWDGSVWEEEVFDWDVARRKYIPGVTYTLVKQNTSPGFFTVEAVKGGQTGAILYRDADGIMLGPVAPRYEIPSDWLASTVKNFTVRENRDSHGNSLKVTEYKSGDSAPTISYTIRYW